MWMLWILLMTSLLIQATELYWWVRLAHSPQRRGSGLSLSRRGLHVEIWAKRSRSLPFYGRGWFAGYIVDHAVHPSDFVHDPVADTRQHIIGQARPICRHKVVRGYGANCDGL